METLSFAFGMLAMIAVALVAVVVVGMVKVIKMKSSIENLEKHLEFLHRDVLERFSKVEKYVYDTSEKNRRELNDRIDETYRYADSRFDKMENKFSGAIAKNQIK